MLRLNSHRLSARTTLFTIVVAIVLPLHTARAEHASTVESGSRTTGVISVRKSTSARRYFEEPQAPSPSPTPSSVPIVSSTPTPPAPGGVTPPAQTPPAAPPPADSAKLPGDGPPAGGDKGKSAAGDDDQDKGEKSDPKAACNEAIAKLETVQSKKFGGGGLVPTPPAQLQLEFNKATAEVQAKCKGNPDGARALTNAQINQSLLGGNQGGAGGGGGGVPPNALLETVKELPLPKLPEIPKAPPFDPSAFANGVKSALDDSYPGLIQGIQEATAAATAAMPTTNATTNGILDSVRNFDQKLEEQTRKLSVIRGKGNQYVPDPPASSDPNSSGGADPSASAPTSGLPN
jgi:hypothetical protein